MLGLGIFTMARKQMLGIQERAERVARESLVLTSFATTMGQRPPLSRRPSRSPPTEPEAVHPEEPEIRVKFKVQDLVSKAAADAGAEDP